MGRDKALLTVRGVRLIDAAVSRLQQVCDDVVVAAGSRTMDGLTVPQVPDQPAGAGPIGGLAAALAAIGTDVAYVLAVDMPSPDMDLMARLAAEWQGEAAVIPSSGGYPQPLHAIWSAAAAPGLALLASGGTRSLIDAARQLGAIILDDAETASLVAHDRWAWNVNRPSDLEPGDEGGQPGGS